MEARIFRPDSLTNLMRNRTQTKREQLIENGQVLKREMLALIDLIDSGEWERFEVRHGEIKKSDRVETAVGAIRGELTRRDNLLHYAKLLLGGYTCDMD